MSSNSKSRNPTGSNIMEKVNAIRLWVFWNGDWVKIRVGTDPVTLAWHKVTEEGFEREEVRYTLAHDRVMRKTHHLARDCDGPMEWFEYRAAKRDRIGASETGDPGVNAPVWERVNGFVDRWGNLQPWFPVAEAC